MFSVNNLPEHVSVLPTGQLLHAGKLYEFVASCPWAPEVADDEYPMRMRPSLQVPQIQEVRSL